MRVVSGVASTTSSGYRDAESLMRSKKISEIRKIEQKTKEEIESKKEELRQLVGNRYRDLIDSADSIVSMKSSCQSISLNISSIRSLFSSLSSSSPSSQASISPSSKARTYWIACRVKYLVDTPENIWGCLDESMFLEAASRHTRARHVHLRLRDLLDSNFPLLNNHWLLVDSLKCQISQRARDLLLSDPSSLPLSSFADALAAVAVTDDLAPAEVLSLFLSSRLSWISLRKGSVSSGEVVSFFCQVLGVIQVTIGQVGELFLRVLNDMPLFYKVVLSSPPVSQLFGGIPDPDEEVRAWNLFREKLELVMVLLDKDYIARACFDWLRDCGAEVVGEINGSCLVDAIASGSDLASAEKLIRETIDSKQVLAGSLDWLASVFGSETELPWSRIRELVLQNDCDLWDEIFEDSFVRRMKSIINEGFWGLVGGIKLGDIVRAIGDDVDGDIDFQAYLSRPSTGGGVWFIEPNAKKSKAVSGSKGLPDESDFESCLGAYFGPDVSRLRESVETHCQSVLEDVILFLESPKAALRLKDLAPFLQDKCYRSISDILGLVKRELDNLYAAMGDPNPRGQSVPQAIVVERSLFIGRLLFAFQNHLKHIPRILGSPRFWVKDDLVPVFDRGSSMWRQLRVVTDSPVSSGPDRQMLSGFRRSTSFLNAALLGVSESPSPKLEEVSRTMRDLCIRAYGLWISWLSNELSTILAQDLGMDDALFATTPLRGWEEIVVKQEQSDVSESEMRIYLPSMPSLYVISFLFQACEEIHRIGGHVLNKSILQQFAQKLLENVIQIYEDFLSNREASSNQVSDKGVLQILLDIRFAADVLSGGDSNSAEELSRSTKVKTPFRRKQELNQTKSILKERINGVTSRFSQRLDPIDWLTYEPYLWENEKQSYLRHAVLFGFFVQLNRKYTDAVQKLATNSESNIMRCSVVPRFKYLPISAPALSSRGTSKPFLTALDDVSLRNSLKGYTNGEVSLKNEGDDNSSFGVAAPILKSFMQVGSRFGESTLKLGSMLTDGQVGIFKDRSAGLLSSFTANRLDS